LRADTHVWSRVTNTDQHGAGQHGDTHTATYIDPDSAADRNAHIATYIDPDSAAANRDPHTATHIDAYQHAGDPVGDPDANQHTGDAKRHPNAVDRGGVR
jgi:hypothetical protein